MANFALISGGVVVQCDRSGSQPDGFIAAPENVVPGYLYANGNFSLPQPTLAARKAARLAALAAKRYAVETGGITIGQSHIQTDRSTCSILTAAFVLASANASYTTRWKIGDGAFTLLDAPTIIAIATAVQEHVQACFDREYALTLAIQGAADAAAVDATDIGAGWPA